MRFAIDKNEHYTVFTPTEEKLNSVLAPDLKTELVLLSNEGTRNIILDLSNVVFVDSSGLSAILVGHRVCEETGGVLCLTAAQESVQKLLSISRLDSELNIFPAVPEARDFVMRRELQRELSGEGGED